MGKRVLGALLCAVLLFGLAAPAAFASEEPAEAEYASVEPVTEAAEAEETAEAAATETEEEEMPEEGLLPEWYADMDPEDPMYEEMMARALFPDGASASSTFSSFKPRSLKNETLHYGIDVSAWQGVIDWKKVKASGVEFAFLRAAYRGTGSGALSTDGQFKSYITAAKTAGVQVGVYIYSQAITVAEAREEARYLVNLVKGYDIDLPLVLDFEYYGTSGRLYNANLSKRAATDICLAFCDEVEKNGYESMVYANPSMLSYSLIPGELGRLWLAHYTKQTTYSGHSYEYWQCGLGAISGISGDVDLDFWFRPIASTPTPSPSPQPVQTDAGPFSDVTEDCWFYEPVMEAYGRGIVNGLEDTLFSPGTTATRGQVVTMLYRMKGKPSVSGTASFADLIQEYYRTPICWAVQNGVVTGYSDTAFGPEDSITREDLVTILYRMAGSPAVTVALDGYGDGAAVRSYAQAAMTWAVKNGIISGYEDTTLRPGNPASRAEVCAVLMRYDALALK